ncbi:MAG: SnoaL-like domain-containing protein [Pyrinomonadaceae bacterium]|nr:SnoaL-like domain-containing protein [Pyrinomonadaceae bacterium]
MKILNFALTLILMLTSIVLAGPDKKNTKVETAVKKVLADQTAAWNKCDIEGFMQGYWKSEELSFTSGNKNTRGWQATFDNYKKGYDSCEKMGKLSFSELDITVLSKKSAMVRGRFLLERKSDKPTGLFTLIFRKFKEGWKVVHDHTSV